MSALRLGATDVVLLTSVSEGFPLIPSVRTLVAASRALLAEPSRRAALRRRGREFVVGAHDRRHIADRLVHALDGAVVATTR